MSFAEDTRVPVSQSRAEIERMLVKYGATRFMSGWDKDGATIAFVMRGRACRFHLPIPEAKDFDTVEFERMGRTNIRKLSPTDVSKRVEQEERRRWRALNLVIKAKLEAVETGIATFEHEFLANIVVGKQTVGEQLLPKLEEFYASGKMPPLLGGGK